MGKWWRAKLVKEHILLLMWKRSLAFAFLIHLYLLSREKHTEIVWKNKWYYQNLLMKQNYLSLQLIGIIKDSLCLLLIMFFLKKNQHPKILYLDYISLFCLLYVLIYLIFSPYVTNCPLISLHARFTNTKS